jgi:hypothetical protein
MPVARIKTLEMAKRRARVAELYLHGRYQWDIATELGVTQGTISTDLKAIREVWRASAVRNFDEAKSQELARIDQLEREYWQAWLRSKEHKESTTTEKVQTGGNDRMKAGAKKEARDGNPAFLAGVQWCITKRCEILGFDAARKLALSEDGGAIAIKIQEEIVETNARNDN